MARELGAFFSGVTTPLCMFGVLLRAGEKRMMPSLWVVFLKLGSVDHADAVPVRRVGCGKEGWGMCWGELVAFSEGE